MICTKPEMKSCKICKKYEFTFLYVDTIIIMRYHLIRYGTNICSKGVGQKLMLAKRSCRL